MHVSAENQNALVLVKQLCARASQDEELKSRLFADPRAILEAETGITFPVGWQVVAAVQVDGRVTVDLANEEIPNDYLELVSGGVPPDSTNPGNSSCW
jgi:hypothetical protein